MQGSTFADFVRAIAEPLLPLIAMVLSVALGAVLTRAHRWLSAKVELDAVATRDAREAMLLRAIDTGVSFAEQRAALWLRDKGELPPSAEKLRWATNLILEMLRNSGLSLTRERIADLIDARLGDPRAPGESHRAGRLYRATTYKLGADDVARLEAEDPES